MTADDQHRRVLRDRPNRRHSRYEGVIHATTDERGHSRRAAADENDFHFQTFSSKEAELLRDYKRQRAAQSRRVGSEVHGFGFNGRDPARSYDCQGK